ncbi:MAG: hypothetical protein LBQ81_11805, partial [Zoogloeaceae bacterium]|nr:hypothetical protein [Zoogloeaceae bacterium]
MPDLTRSRLESRLLRDSACLAGAFPDESGTSAHIARYPGTGRGLAGRFDKSLLEASPAAVPLQAIKEIARENIYVARPALEIETAGFEVLGGLLS